MLSEENPENQERAGAGLLNSALLFELLGLFHQIEAAKKTKEIEPSQLLDLMALFEKSLEEFQDKELGLSEVFLSHFFPVIFPL